MDSRRLFFTLTIVLFVLLTGGTLGCHVYSIRHQPADAVSVAERFVTLALIDHDYDSAMKLVKIDGSKSFDAFTLREIFENRHREFARPNKIEAYIYRTLPQSSDVDVFLSGTNQVGNVYYKVTLVGGRDEGYLVIECSIESDSFEPDRFSVRLDGK